MLPSFNKASNLDTTIVGLQNLDLTIGQILIERLKVSQIVILLFLLLFSKVRILLLVNSNYFRSPDLDLVGHQNLDLTVVGLTKSRSNYCKYRKS
jgi:hypothetical protein